VSRFIGSASPQSKVSKRNSSIAASQLAPNAQSAASANGQRADISGARTSVTHCVGLDRGVAGQLGHHGFLQFGVGSHGHVFQVSGVMCSDITCHAFFAARAAQA
jgi:hypothetical protein